MRDGILIVLAGGLLAMLAGCGGHAPVAVLASSNQTSTSLDSAPAALDSAPAEDPRGEPAAPDAAALGPVVDNPWFPLVPGTVRVFEGISDGASARVESNVTSEIRLVGGVPCAVVHTREFADGALVEDTKDFYAQDADGNVWILGEESAEYEDGVVVATDGTWEAGVAGARAGIVMSGAPVPGEVYSMESRPGQAAEQARVIALETTVVLRDGSSRICLQTKEWDPNDPKEIEYKYYASGEGAVKEEAEDGSSRLEVTGSATAR